jgi:AcrR family transcriptional regulator
MASAESLALRPTRTSAPSQAQTRIIMAALKLFAERGVGGTSLQMIADEIGVTKAAVYHQYKTKDEIVRAVAETELARLETVLDAAEAESSPDRIRQNVIERIIDLAVERRREVSPLLNDPLIGRLYARDNRLLRVLDRLNVLLMGDDDEPESAFATAMLMAALSGAVMHPLVVDRDDETMRRQLLHLARRFLGIPDDVGPEPVA